MAAMTINRGWVKPATILFASEVPANEMAFEFALAQAREFHSRLILFHAYDTLLVATTDLSGNGYYDHVAARAKKRNLEPFAERARRAAVECEVVVRTGPPPDQILAFAHERKVDRIVMGTHSPAGIDKLLLGVGSRGGVAQSRGAGVHRRGGGSEPRTTEFCHQDDSVRGEHARAERIGRGICRRACRSVRSRPDLAACDSAAGAYRGPGRGYIRCDRNEPTKPRAPRPAGAARDRNHRGARRSSRGVAQPESHPPHRLDCAGRSPGVGVWGCFARRARVQDAGRCEVPSDYALTGSIG